MTQSIDPQSGEVTETPEAGQALVALGEARYQQVPPPADLDGWQIATLMDPLNPARISHKQGNSKLSYLEAWDIKAMLNRIFGFANWSADVIESRIIDIDRTWKNSKQQPGVRVSVTATVRLTIHLTGATYTEVAACDQAGSQGLGEVMDFALKTAESDAVKRCAINLGTQFGLSLYNDGSTGDVVQVIFDPSQAAALAAGRKVRQEQQMAASRAISQGAPASTGTAANAPQPGAQPQQGMGAVAGAFNREG